MLYVLFTYYFYNSLFSSNVFGLWNRSGGGLINKCTHLHVLPVSTLVLIKVLIGSSTSLIGLPVICRTQEHPLVSWCVGLYTDMLECGEFVECLGVLCVVASESVFVLGLLQSQIWQAVYSTECVMLG